ncbi:hypothetical protein EON82_22565 [bacterium]|nr:MAG: hypothetical protein EON82_22565 [bacterium]
MAARQALGRAARAVAMLAFLASFFPILVYNADGDKARDLAFQAGGSAFAVLCVASLALIVAGYKDESDARKAALVWWTAGVSSVFLQVLGFMGMSGQ